MAVGYHNSGRRERILIIFPGALGDLVCFAPAIRALRRRHHQASLELMAHERLARFAVGRLGIDHAHSIDRREVGLLFTGSVEPEPIAREFFRGFTRIYSFFASDEPAFRSSLGLVASGAISFHPFRPDGSGHVAAGYLRSIGEPPEPLEARIDLLVDDLAAASRRLQACGLEPRRFVAIMPGSGSPKKNWPADKYAELVRHLHRRISIAIVLGRAEADVVGFFSLSGAPVLNGLDLGELAGVLASACLFVGNDSGVSHLAAAAGAAGAAIFGPTDPERWRPLGDVAVVERFPMSDLGVGEVASMVEAMLSRFAAARDLARVTRWR
jgi:ADP-heptose:LPS heptosyltransferase